MGCWQIRLVVALAIMSEKKAGVVEHLEVFDHAGLLGNRPLGMAELPLI